MPPITNDWADYLKKKNTKSHIIGNYTKKLWMNITLKLIFPPADDIFNAFHFTPVKDVKVVILGQDPYHGNGQAHGLSFSVKPGVEVPPSLVNIYKELNEDLGCYIPNNGYLKKWADQGCYDVKHSIDCTGTSCEFSQRYWMGGVY